MRHFRELQITFRAWDNEALWKKKQNLGPTSLIKVMKYKGFVKISSNAATEQDVKSIGEVRCRRKKA